METKDLIDIFIITKNRAEYLKQSIESILNQTAKIESITILDNESSDNTEQIVAQYPKCKYVKTHGFLGNFNKARELVNKPYVMLFHDDDLLNPEYIQFATDLINKYNPSIITTKYLNFYNDNPPFARINRNYYLFNNQKEFARYMIGVECVSYCSAIYKTESFLSEQLEYDKYGKFNDWMFMAKIANYGKSIITADKNMLLVRKHNSQDTYNINTALTGEQIINWDKFFYDILKDTDIELLSKSYHFLRSKYDQFTTKEFKKAFSFEQVRSEFLRLCPLAPQSMNEHKLKEIKKELEQKCLIK